MPLVWHLRKRLPVSQPHRISHIPLAFSPDARYLAVGAGENTNIWKLEGALDSPHVTLLGKDDYRVKRVSWVNPVSLLVAHDKGRVHCATLESESEHLKSRGFREGSHGETVALAVMEGGLVAIAFVNTVQVWKKPENSTHPWSFIGELPKPAGSFNDSDTEIIVKSMFALRDRHLLVAYGNAVVVTWQLNVSASTLQTETKSTFNLNGILSDVCYTTGDILVTSVEDNEYRLLRDGSCVPFRSFKPRSRHFKEFQAVSWARFLSPDTILGAGTNQFILWDTNGRRLQNLVVGHDERGITSLDFHLILSSTSVYHSPTDKGYLAAAVKSSEGYEIWIWATEDVNEEEPEPDVEEVVGHSQEFSVRTYLMMMSKGPWYLSFATLVVVMTVAAAFIYFSGDTA